MWHARYLPEKLSNLKLVMLIAHSSNNLALQKNVINERMLNIDVNNVLMVYAKERYSHNTSVARILQWRGENDVTFDDTLYTEADPESFSGGNVILN